MYMQTIYNRGGSLCYIDYGMSTDMCLTRGLLLPLGVSRRLEGGVARLTDSHRLQNPQPTYF